jgi:hypothetical protein
VESYRLTKTLSIDVDFDGLLGYDLGELFGEKFKSQLVDLVYEEIKNFRTETRSATKGSTSLFIQPV